MLTILLSLLLPTAVAADTNGDGCVDSFFDANSACVATTASLDASVVVEANSVIRDYATIGADTTIASDVYVGARAMITGRVSAVGTLSVQANTHIGRSVTIGADHIIGADNSIGRSVTIGARIETGATVALGYADIVGDDVFLGAGTVVGNRAQIGNNTTVESGTVLARSVTILDSASSASIGGIIGPDVQIGANADISNTARIRKRAMLGDNVTVLGNVRIARDVQIGDGATIGANVKITAGAQVTANSNVPDGAVVTRDEVFDNAAGSFVGGSLVSQAEQSQLNQWVGDTDANWELCYKRTVDGASAAAFHSGCDSYAGTITVALSGGKKFGGYTPLSWVGGNYYKTEPGQQSFLFSLTNNHRHSLTSTNHHIYVRTAYGPTFGGGHDLRLFGDGFSGYCNIGHTYACRVSSYTSSTCRVDFCGTNGSFTVNEVEVYGRL
ncbi:MAG: UDP-3-O-[3-hydroxymyristoyl] glucosamine N-acyltransferase [Myxococcota bacterium]|jgi:UDP-3-O-[3-hydroxymyristoyl] glucosamine N-acyltransferase